MAPSHHNRCRLLIGLIIFIVWSIGTILFWFVNVFAYIGSTFILMGDYITHVFTIIGVKEPEIGWLLLGCLVGSILGLIQGLKQTGRYSDLYKVYLAVVVIVLIFQGVTYWQWKSQFDVRDFQDIVLKEDFTSSQGWRLTKGAAIKEGSLFHPQSYMNSPSWSIWEVQNFSDVDFSAEVTKASGSDNIYFGLLARVSEDTNPTFYYLKINGYGNYVMGKSGNEQSEDRIKPKSTDILNVGNSENHLKIVCKDNLIMGFINNKMVGFFRDSSYSSGKIAVYTEGDEANAVAVYFDNVLVKKNDSSLSAAKSAREMFVSK